MNIKLFFIELLQLFLDGKLSRAEVAEKIANEVPIDTNYIEDEKLMNNCEWGLRHINELGYYSTETELSYYLSCLKGEKQYDTGDIAM